MLLRAALLTSLTVALVASSSLHGQDARLGSFRSGLEPTIHPALPVALSQYWLVAHPSVARTPAAARQETPAQRFARGVQLISQGDFAGGLPLVNNPALAKTALAGYAQYYTAIALINLSRAQEAEAFLTSDAARDADGYMSEAIALRAADVALLRNDAGRAVDVLDDLVDEKLLSPEGALLQLARAAERAGDLDRALVAYRKLYYDMPLTAQSADAQAALARLETPSLMPSDKVEQDLKRAEGLYAVRRWPQARTAFEALVKTVQDEEDRTLIRLRLAELDFHQSRLKASRDALAKFTEDGPHEAEARFYFLSATRGLGDHATYVRLARKLVEDHPDTPWAEDTLNNLASHYIVVDEDDAADQVFRQMLRAFPRGRFGDRAAWRIGWRAYRAGDYREAADVFELAAVSYPRADYRPAWIYWSGRARDQLKDSDAAVERFTLAIQDYQNSYYGRLAMKARAERRSNQERIVSLGAPAAQSVPTDGLIRELVTLQLYDDALREVQFAQRKWGDSPQLQATGAFIRHHQGLTLKADERFSAIRGAINTMRRAYPQFMASGGEKLPPEVLRIIFPLDYWPLITKYAKQHGLDPYLIAALMAQESTFTPEIKSSANAIGLMQLIPSTGRQYARKLGIRNFTTNSLTNPETNVRLGTEYFKELITRFGSAHYALASYNAGENRVAQWIRERPPLPEDEFVDDIPFQETQTYVKRIIGTAEDYRRLYGGGLLDPNASLAVPGSTSAAPPPAKPAAPAPAKRVSPQRTTTQKPAARAPAKPATKRSSPSSGAKRR